PLPGRQNHRRSLAQPGRTNGRHRNRHPAPTRTNGPPGLVTQDSGVNIYNFRPHIGVLALQGDFAAHIQMLATLGVEGTAIRLPKQLEEINGIIIPGGESTTIGKLMVSYNLQDVLQKKIQEGFPVWGTCAGLILLAKETDNALAGQPLLA